MAVIYRTAGPWGAGKGSNLTAAEVDGNFNTLQLLIDDLTENAVQGVSVSDFIVSGLNFSVILSDASILGPYPLPFAAFAWQGEYTPGFEYQPFDVFQYGSRSVYLVLSPHEAPTEFDPAETNTEGADLYALMFDISGKMEVVTLSDDHIITIDDMGAYLRFTGATPVVLTVPVILDLEAGHIVSVRQVGAGQVQVSPETGVTVFTPETMYSRTQNATLTLTYVGNDEWDLAGDLELV